MAGTQEHQRTDRTTGGMERKAVCNCSSPARRCTCAPTARRSWASSCRRRRIHRSGPLEVTHLVVRPHPLSARVEASFTARCTHTNAGANDVWITEESGSIGDHSSDRRAGPLGAGASQISVAIPTHRPAVCHVAAGRVSATAAPPVRRFRPPPQPRARVLGPHPHTGVRRSDLARPRWAPAGDGVIAMRRPAARSRQRPSAVVA